MRDVNWFKEGHEMHFIIIIIIIIIECFLRCTYNLYAFFPPIKNGHNLDINDHFLP